MKTETKEVGIIGQTYENRVSKKIGVLESREEKFKTLLMRDENGNSFNVSYSTFKSSWRKYAGDKVIQTSSQVEEARDEEKHEAEVNEKAVKVTAETVKKSAPKKKNPEDNMRLNQHFTNTLSELVKNTHIRVQPCYKGYVALCISNRHLVEFWPKAHLGAFDICVRADFYEAYKDKFKEEALVGENVHYHDDWKLKYAVKFIAVEALEKVSTDIITNLAEFQQTLPNSKTDKKEEVEDGTV